MNRFKLGSFNLYNLVLPNITYYRNKKYTENAYAKKIDWIAFQLNQMDAEIVGFQEIFHKDALVNAAQNTKFSDENIYVLGETGESPVVGMASTFPVVEEPVLFGDIPQNILQGLGSIAVDIPTFSRPILKAKVEIKTGLVVTVFVSHLKSKRPVVFDGEDENEFSVVAMGETRALLRRAVEAAGLRQLVIDESMNTNTPIILIGDLNDSARSVTTNIIAGPHPWKFDSVDVKKSHWDNLLYNSFDIVSQKSYKVDFPTHIYNGHYESLDHIFVSQEFYGRNRSRIGKVDFVNVLDDHLQDDTLSRDRLPNWKSDHGQVVTSISLI